MIHGINAISCDERRARVVTRRLLAVTHTSAYTVNVSMHRAPLYMAKTHLRTGKLHLNAKIFIKIIYHAVVGER